MKVTKLAKNFSSLQLISVLQSIVTSLFFTLNIPDSPMITTLHKTFDNNLATNPFIKLSPIHYYTGFILE